MKNNRFKLFNVLRSKDIDEGIALADVYENWYEEICNSFIKFGSKTYNNAICEGINNKIKAIKRSSFGILNFSHLRARVFLSFRNMTPEKMMNLFKNNIVSFCPK